MGWLTCGRARDVVADAKCLDELFEEPRSLAAAPTDVTLEIEETAAPPPEAEEAREAGMVVAVRLRPCDGDAATAVDGDDVTVSGRAFDSLGGSSYTAVLCCVHPGAGEAANATATLRFASRLRSVTTKPRKNVDPKDAEIARLRAANAALAREVARLAARLA
ncbi:hypothetical protein JL720_2497 [Aureococcus anophagefferens]|nr:hypothetical protein JL720_2497 [Aureococcus anophagefferens]